jgi:hypothetical protein
LLCELLPRSDIRFFSLWFGEKARFIFSIDERAQKDLLARASVLQKPTHQSAYGKINPPPDISGLMRALLFYYGDFETETAEVNYWQCLL